MAVTAGLDLSLDLADVYERHGQRARTRRVTIGGNRHVFAYNYDTQEIPLKVHNTRGAVIEKFDNKTARAFPAPIAVTFDCVGVYLEADF